MIYLSKEDLISITFERFVDESSESNTDIIDSIEAQNIKLIKSYIGSRYNVTLIFSEVAAVKNEILTRILVKLVLYDLIRRNAARKVPTDFKEEYDAAMTLLRDVSTGRITLYDLPLPIDESGNIISNTLWGNNTNEDFYI